MSSLIQMFCFRFYHKLSHLNHHFTTCKFIKLQIFHKSILVFSFEPFYFPIAHKQIGVKVCSVQLSSRSFKVSQRQLRICAIFERLPPALLKRLVLIHSNKSVNTRSIPKTPERKAPHRYRVYSNQLVSFAFFFTKRNLVLPSQQAGGAKTTFSTLPPSCSFKEICFPIQKAITKRRLLLSIKLFQEETRHNTKLFTNLIGKCSQSIARYKT